ncbi:tRNA (adenosine(37)-N6)-threonylcarbamoyltransferase complex dimerization subunit type 1 TsaB [Actinotignum sanguinis]|uniref:tRNA (Adenosine(37)-N6)-threonylcarbamoyltransferase complex dimerization subunit type 1 TsaB n=1 Tax=Actinotignum sanguinis TaxID=1445614 RepID=A0ABT5V8K0_9ACTO|nr:tRNA (adenosine(37)-N6)-threonylcarbamoyltransferase complex dimerization subunit type 1 TsaB [Actinotignum sanguinis]MDE1656312.1 tRNA (adenosine(37)-N6)-threonylcarbamoyltransferase complex dimerization subunit type 1 TsaB [Actinotignum sanguinis]
MNILTIDTSDLSVVGLVRVDRFGNDGATGNIATLAREVSADSRHHAETLTPMVAAVLKAAGVDRADAIVAGTGPGAFTGLRAGLVTARTLAFAWDVPLYGVSSLEVRALGALREGAARALAVIDARRKELYVLVAEATACGNALSGALRVVDGPRIIRPAEVPELRGEHTSVVVSHEDMYPELSGAHVVECEPELMVARAAAKLAAGEVLDTEPQYLRRPDIAQGVAQPAGSGYLGS